MLCSLAVCITENSTKLCNSRKKWELNSLVHRCWSLYYYYYYFNILKFSLGFQAVLRAYLCYISVSCERIPILHLCQLVISKTSLSKRLESPFPEDKWPWHNFCSELPWKGSSLSLNCTGSWERLAGHSSKWFLILGIWTRVQMRTDDGGRIKFAYSEGRKLTNQ